MYKGKRRTEVPPHIFAICDGAYSDMLTSKSYLLKVIHLKLWHIFPSCCFLLVRLIFDRNLESDMFISKDTLNILILLFMKPEGLKDEKMRNRVEVLITVKTE